MPPESNHQRRKRHGCNAKNVHNLHLATRNYPFPLSRSRPLPLQKTEWGKSSGHGSLHHAHQGTSGPGHFHWQGPTGSLLHVPLICGFKVKTCTFIHNLVDRGKPQTQREGTIHSESSWWLSRSATIPSNVTFKQVSVGVRHFNNGRSETVWKWLLDLLRLELSCVFIPFSFFSKLAPRHHIFCPKNEAFHTDAT